MLTEEENGKVWRKEAISWVVAGMLRIEKVDDRFGQLRVPQRTGGRTTSREERRLKVSPYALGTVALRLDFRVLALTARTAT